MNAFRWAMTFSDGITSAEKFVLVVLADMYNEKDRYAWPAIATIMRMTSLGERTVKRALSSLEEQGFIERRRRYNASGQTSSAYYLPMYDSRSDPQVSATQARSAGQTGTHPRPVSATEAPGGGQTGTLTTREPLLEEEPLVEPVVARERARDDLPPSPFCDAHPTGTTEKCIACIIADKANKHWHAVQEAKKPKISDRDAWAVR